jgi:hypothetical protein
MGYYSSIQKHEIMSFGGKWMELDLIMLNEIRQTQKDKYHRFSFICAESTPYKNDMNVKGVLFWGRVKRRG